MDIKKIPSTVLMYLIVFSKYINKWRGTCFGYIYLDPFKSYIELIEENENRIARDNIYCVNLDA